MSTEELLESRREGVPTLDEITTLLWTKEMGERMQTVRMKMSMNQAECAARFGMGQPAFSKVERGVVHVCEKITVAKMREVFGDKTHYIFFGSNPERFNKSVIGRKYWDERWRNRRKNKSTVYSKSRFK